MQQNTLRIISILISIIGLVLVLKSPTLGSESANTLLRSAGGSMDTSKFMVHLEAYTVSYRLIGGILLGVGLFHALRK